MTIRVYTVGADGSTNEVRELSVTAEDSSSPAVSLREPPCSCPQHQTEHGPQGC